MSNYHRQASRKSTRTQGKSRQYINYLARSLALIGLIVGGNPLGLLPLLAAPATGMTIDNQATGTFADLDDTSAGTQNVVSNTVTVTIGEVAGITVTAGTPSEAPASVANPGTAQGNGVINPGDIVYFDYIITNAGNDATQFFIPDSPSSIVGGTFVQTTNPIEIIAYNPGTGSVAVAGVTVPSGGQQTGPSAEPMPVAATDSLLGKNGIIPVGGSVTIRVPIKVSAGVTQVSVVMGNTAPNDNSAATQNQVYSNNTNLDIYTQDNPDGTTNGAGTVVETSTGSPLNGDTTNHRQEASAKATVPVIKLAFPPIANCDANNYAINAGAGAGVGGMNLLSGLSPGGYTPSIISPESSFLVNPAYSLVKAGDNNLYYAIASVATTTSNPTYVYKYDVAANTHSQTTWQLPAVGADGYWISGSTDPAGMLYFLSGKGHKLVKIDPYTDTVSTVWSSSPVTTVPGPGGIVFGTDAVSGSYYDLGFDVNGDAFFVDNYNRHIWKVINVNSGTPTAQYLGTILGPAGVNFSDIVWLKDSGGTQRLYAISTGGIYNLDPSTFATTFVPGSTTSYYDVAGCHDFGSVGGPTKAKLQLVKRITAIKDGVTAATTTFNTFNDDASTTDDNSCKWPSASSTAGVCSNTYTVGATTQTAPKVKPGDEIEYTVYYLNGGRNAATPVRVCDILNPNLTFSPQGGSGIGIAKGGAAMTMLTNGTDGDKGQLTTPALATNCNLPAGNSGSEVVVVDVGYTGVPLSGGLSSGFPTTSYGYIRFKAVVK
jgi:uncharacterized repeat protein (TIGR01451 family)